MTDIAIRVENLSELYRIGRAPHSAVLRDSLRSRHDTLRDALVDSLPRVIVREVLTVETQAQSSDFHWSSSFSRALRRAIRRQAGLRARIERALRQLAEDPCPRHRGNWTRASISSRTWARSGAKEATTLSSLPSCL
jgi:hypothetical protein